MHIFRALIYSHISHIFLEDIILFITHATSTWSFYSTVEYHATSTWRFYSTVEYHATSTWSFYSTVEYHSTSTWSFYSTVEYHEPRLEVLFHCRISRNLDLKFYSTVEYQTTSNSDVKEHANQADALYYGQNNQPPPVILVHIIWKDSQYNCIKAVGNVHMLSLTWDAGFAKQNW